MKLATVRIGSEEKVVAVDESEEIARVVGSSGGMLDLIERHGTSGTPIPLSAEAYALSEVSMLAPIPRPRRNIFCVGKNYREHAEEFTRSGFDSSARSAAESVPDFPIVFSKVPECVVADGDSIRYPSGVSSAVDYEAELAVVIGRGGRNIRRQDAKDHVFGFAIFNDVTSRDLQARHKQWLIGKSLDTFGPFGPWLVTADEVDAANLDIECRVNGQLRQRANTRDLIFDVPHLIETISSGVTLYPGDVIATGTPAGVGIGFTPPKYLVPGDTIEIEITGLGRLVNTIVSEN